MKSIRKYCILFIAVVILVIFGIVAHRRYEQNLYESLKDEMTTMGTDLVEETLSIDFSYLESVNKDIYAWIDIPGTDISYPVLQSGEKEENYYLRHNVDGSYGYPGTIFSQLSNAADFSDPVTVLYGHNMRNGSMFAQLHKYEDADFFVSNSNITIYTPTGKLDYVIFASLTYDDRLILSVYDNFENKEDVLNFYNEVMEQADNKNYAISVTEESHLLVLSTCLGDPDKRYLVLAALNE